MRIFIIISTDNIGGAEKRFVGLWQSFCQNNFGFEVFLVAPSNLVKILSNEKEARYYFEKFQHLLIQHELSGGFKNYKHQVKIFVREKTVDGDILHFIGDHPLTFFKRRKQVYTITQSSFKNLNFTGKLGQMLGVYFADIVDILDPGIYKKIQNLFIYKRKIIYRTSNSFCDTSVFYSLPFHEKNDWFVFLGRFEEMKQPLALLNSIPAVYNELKKSTTNNIHFFFFGYGTLENEMKSLLSESKFQRLPITIEYNDEPYKILARSKFFFSIQLHNNYPSKSLIEAMSSGNIPIVTDVGQTRWLAKPEFSYYIPEFFTEEDLTHLIRKIYKEDKNSLALKSELARKFVEDEHTIEKMQSYFVDIYKKL